MIIVQMLNSPSHPFVNWLIEILADIKYSYYANKHNIIQDNYLWAGIEANPKEEDDKDAE